MKKILLITIAIFIMLPVANSYAYTNGLLEGLTTQENLPEDIFVNDNDATTKKPFSTNEKATFNLPYTATINRIYFDNEAGSNFKVNFYDSTGALIKAELMGSSFQPRYIDITPIANVKTVILTTGEAYAYNVREFDVYGTSSAPIVHSPITNLTETHNHNTVNLNWTNPTGTEFTGTIIKQNGVEVANLANNTSGYTINGLTPETTYNFEVIAKYSDTTNSTAESIQVTTIAEPVDNSPTGEITNLMVEKTFESVSFVYSLPIDTDFSHLDIYRNGTLIKSNHTLNTFDDIGLVANTSYVYKFVSVDEMGNQSTGYSQTVLTDIEIDGQAPPVPEDVNTTDGNGSGQVTWATSSATDIDGYNVFIDGVKHNTNLIKGTTYTIPNLENATTYNITVSAVDTSGNESAQSTIMTITPSLNAMPIFEMKYSLKDVADGTSNWFGSLWLILAFSVAIPLTFLIARRIKGLMIA